MNRRNFLSAATAGAAAPAHALEAQTSETPIIELYRQIEEINSEAATYDTGMTGDEENDELDRLFYNRRDQLEARMMALPCLCAADFAAKVVVSTCQGDLFHDWDTGAIWKEARALIAGSSMTDAAGRVGEVRRLSPEYGELGAQFFDLSNAMGVGIAVR